MSQLDPELLHILACPCDAHGALHDVPDTARRAGVDAALQCESCERAFPVKDGIPVLLLDEAL